MGDGSRQRERAGAPSEEAARRERDRRPRPRGFHGTPPDSLYHATSRRRFDLAIQRGRLEVRGGRPVFLSRFEDQAWQIAHRLVDEPMVLYIDVSRARRAGCRFERNAQGLWQVASVPVRHVLNAVQGFKEQVSAGGIPVWYGPDGPQIALIAVERRYAPTWEVAKGKLELAETPQQAAVREVREELGCPMDLEIEEDLGAVRYGFFTPDGSPRLKTLHMYLMRTPERREDFHPAVAEGVLEVRWFDPEEAAQLVAHRSLRPLMRRVASMLAQPKEAQGL